MPDPCLDRPSPTLTRLRRLALFGEITSFGSVVLIVGFVGFALVLPDIRSQWIKALGVELGGSDLLGILVAAIPTSTFALSLYFSGRLFRALRGTEVFGSAAVAALSGLGWSALATALLAILSRTALGLIATASAPAGQHQLVLSLSSSDLAAVLIGLLAFTLSGVMAEAIRLSDDLRTIV